MAVLMTLCMVLALLPGTALAATVAKGNCGERGGNVIWLYDTDHVLTITGYDSMEDYQHEWEYAVVPWYIYRREIKHIVVEESVTRIGNEAFGSLYGAGVSGDFYPNLESISIADTVQEIGEYAFFSSHLPSIDLPKSLKTIEFAAFYCSDLESVTIPNGTTRIGRAVFQDCSHLTSVSIPNSVIFIGGAAFAWCQKLTNVTLPNKLTSIITDTFLGCSALTSVTIPRSVTDIGNAAFAGCYDLSDVYYGGSEAEWKAISIADKNEQLLNATIHCSDGTLINEKPDDGQLHGKVSVSGVYNASGETVTLRATPDPGYELSSIKVTDSDGSRSVWLTPSVNMGTYTFRMPAYDVTVHVKFTKNMI